MDQSAKDILEIVNFIKDHMLTKDEGATKNDVRDTIRKEVPELVRKGTNDMRAELALTRRDLESLAATLDNIAGLPKEIDHALERIATIEKHLGINKEIAA